MRFIRLALLIVLLPAIARAQSTDAQPPKPVDAIRHVVIISIDGLRPDVALRANMPALRSLLARGSYSFWARTTEMSITLPSHVSMLTGVRPDTHGIVWNDDRAGPEDLHVPTLFERAKAGGYTTALIAGKKKFRIFAKPGAVDTAIIAPTDTDNDQSTADHAAALIRSNLPGLLVMHFGEVDNVGHGVGWGTPQQIARVEQTDGRLALILAALREAKLDDSTALILTADHGGTGRWHGADDIRSRHIPWIAVGPGIGQNVDLTRFRDLTINTEDTFATACWLLGVSAGDPIDGKPIHEIMADYELLTPTTAPAVRPATRAMVR